MHINSVRNAYRDNNYKNDDGGIFEVISALDIDWNLY
jgi:hypothetical protein